MASGPGGEDSDQPPATRDVSSGESVATHVPPSRFRAILHEAAGKWGHGAANYLLRGLAYELKTLIQMAIGVLTIIELVDVHAGDFWHWRVGELAPQLLKGIGVGLAAAAVVELAYTLFTPGPDEALDPLMLGLSAALLLLAGDLGPDNISVERAAALLLLGILLAALFATRLFLAEGPRPRIWWVQSIARARRHRR